MRTPVPRGGGRRLAGSLLPLRSPDRNVQAQGSQLQVCTTQLQGFERGKSGGLAPRVVLSDVRNGVIGEGNDGVGWPLGSLHGRASRGGLGHPASQVLEDAPHHRGTRRSVRSRASALGTLDIRADLLSKRGIHIGAVFFKLLQLTADNPQRAVPVCHGR